MLRLVIALAIIVLRPVGALSQTAEAVDAAKTAIAGIQHDGVSGSVAVAVGLGLVAIIVFMGLIVRALYNANVTLQNKRAEEAGRVAEAALVTATKTEVAIDKLQEDMRELARTQQTIQTAFTTMTGAMTNMASQLERGENRWDRVRNAG